jgi:DNA-binding beta-propeller fold protein YncE
VYLQTEGKTWRKLGGVHVDRETGDVVVADTGNNLVTVLSPEGVPLYSIGYNGEVPQPTHAVVDKRGRFLVLAGVPRKVRIFDYHGELLGDFNFPGFEAAANALPTAITIDAAGNFYVADSTSGRILVYDPDDRLVLSIGNRGDGPGTFRSVTAITVDDSGSIYVADAQHKPTIQVFNAQGEYLRGWGEHNAGPQNFSLPSAVGLDSTGRVLVADTIRQTISVFTTEGNYLFRFGGLGTGPGALAYPAGLAVDPAGRLYVSEYVNARVQVFELAEARTPGGAPARRQPSAPPRLREELRRGLGEVLKEIQR